MAKETKEQFYERAKAARSILANPDNIKCTCPENKCIFHGNCVKCVALHRYNKRHVPQCLEIVFNDKIKEVAEIFEINGPDKIPEEYWDYVREKDKENAKSK